MRVMTLRFTVLSMLCLFWISHPAVAQDTKVTFSRQETTVGDVMETIRSQTHYVFAFENSSFDTARPVKLEVLSMSVTDAMDAITEGVDHGYMIQRHFIVINTKPRPAVSRPAPPRTGDRYRPSEPGNPDSYYQTRPTTEPLAQPETQPMPGVSAEPIIAYSHYQNPNRYAQIQENLPSFAVKTNLLYGAATFTPNLGVEIGLNRKSTLEFSAGWNQWNYIGTQGDNKKLNHMVLRPEYRWWFCERYNGHFVGAHAFYARYNISEYEIPMLFKKEYRYEGHAFGAGVTYGYHLALAKRWGLEFNIGVGVAQLNYERYDCTLCSEVIDKPSKTYFGVTRAGINLVFLIK